MTAMNALVRSDTIVLSMDTLVSVNDGDRLVPGYFSQKFEYLPFAKSVICGTGNFEITKEVFKFSRTILVCEVDTLLELVFKKLVDLDRNEYSRDESTVTIYIFGFDENGKTKAFSLRSTKNFIPELIADSKNPRNILKPSINNNIYSNRIMGAFNQDDEFKALVDIMRIQKEYDDTISTEKVGIGGENVCLLIADNSKVSIINKIDVFDDYQEKYKFCLDRLHENS